MSNSLKRVLMRSVLVSTLAVLGATGCSSTDNELAKAETNKKTKVSNGPLAGCNTVAAKKKKRCNPTN